jgi:flavorubredoxin
VPYAAIAPTVRAEPEEVAADTFVIHHVQEALGQPLFVYLNSMVIRGAEPMILDTGTIGNRKQWLEDVFTIVEPTDVKWVFLSHDDVDHTGNLELVLDACPNARLVSSWAITERHTNAFDFPLDRCHWINDGESFDIGDRTVTAIRPPLYDSPTTRGLFDSTTGVYWGVDSFACPMPGNVMQDASEFDPGFWAEGMAMFMYHALSPWLSIVDPVKFGATCDRVQALGAKTIVTAHSPVINENTADKAFQILRDLPSVPAPPCPDNNVLQMILAGAGEGA